MTMMSTRKKWLAALLSLIIPGLGQIYVGELLRGVCFLIFFIFSPLLLANISVLLPDKWLLAGLGIALTTTLVIYLYALVDAWRLAGENDRFYQLREYNRLAFYLAAWLVGTVLIVSTDQYLKNNYVQAYKIVGESMAPAVLQGDYVLVKKPAYRNRSIKKGDIVIAVYPDDRSKVLIRMIEAMPEEILTQKDGTTVTVPHGTVMIRGTNTTNNNTLDSSTFGPLDMRDIVGRVTHIYFSRDGRNIRWKRMFTQINS